MNNALITNFIEELKTYENKEDIICNIVRFLRKNSDAFSVAIRIQDGNDFPYYTTIGFTDNFIKSENFLCCKNKKGDIELEEDGTVKLECVCGNIISKNEKCRKCMDCYTRNGSFWTNSASNLIKETNGDIGFKTRGTCIESGYKSIAIIPIPYKDKNIGLIQLNDFEENKFSIDLISSVEDLAFMIGKVFEHLDEANINKDERRKVIKDNIKSIIKDLQRMSESILTKDAEAEAKRLEE